MWNDQHQTNNVIVQSGWLMHFQDRTIGQSARLVASPDHGAEIYVITFLRNLDFTKLT